MLTASEQLKIFSEIIGDYTMAASRKNDAPGNIRAGQYVIGQRTNVLADEKSEKREFVETVRALVIRSDGKILAIVEPDNDSYISFPGGRVEEGETTEDALRRELWEETGLIAGDVTQLRVDTDNAIRITLYKVKNAGGRLRPSKEGTPSWVEPQELLMSKYSDYYHKTLTELGIL